MDLETIIADLGRMPEPDRKADRTIAYALGVQEKAGPTGVYWVIGEKNFTRIPAFTSSVDAAIIAAEAVGPVDMIGVTVGRNVTHRAILNNGDYCEGATPAIALCIAALRQLSARGKQ
ncbi:hypothetical protein [Sinorhizobium meliloti]|uniref:hypothetical protein n=1 Tax=Rhizobium meliloti TaxID=382 RepID=UPI000FD4B5E4|nr:hypothetical protein [Sinorhizobium meliloti]MDW9633599.1 hypothetical protein [Sinorhizobium meliloti]RVJ90023.1 hypothetical protein CN173_24380 [Sinorhizobium meliloti]